MTFKEAWDAQARGKRVFYTGTMGTFYITVKEPTKSVKWDCGTKMSFKAFLSDEWEVEDGKIKLTTESGEAIYISRESLEELKKL